MRRFLALAALTSVVFVNVVLGASLALPAATSGATHVVVASVQKPLDPCAGGPIGC